MNAWLNVRPQFDSQHCCRFQQHDRRHYARTITTTRGRYALVVDKQQSRSTLAVVLVNCQSILQMLWYWVIRTAEEVRAQAFGFTGLWTSEDPLLHKHTCRHKKFHVKVGPCWASAILRLQDCMYPDHVCGQCFCHQSCAHSPQQCTDIPVIPH